MMTPAEAIAADPPNVWLTNFYGFDPDKWGFLGFSNTGQRDHFVRETKPGCLVVIYGHKAKASEAQQGQIIGIQQVSHRVNVAKAYMDPVAWARKEDDPEMAGKWDLAVKATRAWRVAPESYVRVDDFADETYSLGAAQIIGSLGKHLTSREAAKLLDLVVIRTSVYGERAIEAASAVPGSLALTPSKAGPVSQQGHFAREAEGPKQLYVLRLDGNADAWIGRPANEAIIVKVGMSVSPASRRDALNAALPAGAFQWSILHSNDLDGTEPFPSSKPALQGENVIKRDLALAGDSLGGEFFLATSEAVTTAWRAGQAAASAYPHA